MTTPVLDLSGFDNDTATVTDEVLVAAVAGKRISVYQLYVSAAQATTVTFESGSEVVHVQYVGAGGGSVLPFTGIAWFATNSGVALTYTTDTAGGCVVRVKAAAL